MANMMLLKILNTRMFIINIIIYIHISIRIKLAMSLTVGEKSGGWSDMQDRMREINSRA